MARINLSGYNFSSRDVIKSTVNHNSTDETFNSFKSKNPLRNEKKSFRANHC
jgi:hypothetical protein